MSIVHSHAAGVVYVDDGSGNSGNSRHDRHYAYSRWLFGCWRGNGLFPAIAHPYMKKVTGSDDVAIGHFSTLSYVLAGFIGSKFGNKEHSTEDMNVPKSLLFLRDTPVAISFTMIIIFLLTCLFAGADAVKELSGGKTGSCSLSCNPLPSQLACTSFCRVCAW